MKRGQKQKILRANDIKVVVKNRPTKEQANFKLKQLEEFLSNNWRNEDENPLG